MIYTYKYLKHKIEDFHNNVAYFFEQLFFCPPPIFDEAVLFKPDFIPLVNKSPERLRKGFEDIFNAYLDIKEDDVRIKIHQAFKTNNEIEKLCNGDIVPVKFGEIADATFRKLLHDFCIMLWDGYPQNELIKEEFGTVQEHFDSFTKRSHQRAYVCPFCGIHKLKPSGGLRRDDYDHFLAKSLYPFISINFKNLFPACDECNTDEKRTTDTLFDGENVRRAFFPYDASYSSDSLKINIDIKEAYNPVTLKTLLNDVNWDYEFKLDDEIDDRLVTWNDVYKIARRYKENLLVYEIEWFDELKNKYKEEIKKGTNFSDFQNEVLSNSKYRISNSGMGVLVHSYYCFIFSLPDIQSRLDEILEQET